MKGMGLDMVIVQWVAEVDATNVPSHSGVMLQHIDAVEAIVSAAARENLSVILGLEHDPNWWNEITAPPEVLRDYLLVRVSRQEILQKALLERFGAETHWTGYYIADEIDDRSWRDPARQTILRHYIALLQERLRARDPARTVGISAFYRGRTEPGITATNLVAVLAETGIDHVLLQDGAGEKDPPAEYRTAYNQAFEAAWSEALPERWAVVETFARTSDPSVRFAAGSAGPERVLSQIADAAPWAGRLIFFSFAHYMDPDSSAPAAKLYETLKSQYERTEETE
jgi:hypothetical protein